MIRLAVAAEDELGNWLVRDLTDRCLLEFAWIEPESIEHFREWQDFEGGEWWPLHRVKELARARLGIRTRGRFRGEPGAPDALMLRKLFMLVAETPPRPNVLIVARDDDGRGRDAGFTQARAERNWPFEIVKALARPEAEAWLISAWRPSDDKQTKVLLQLRQRLGLDPTARSHALSSTSSGPRDAKVVLEELEASGRPAKQCFASAGLGELSANGTENGIAEFLAEQRAALQRHLNAR